MNIFPWQQVTTSESLIEVYRKYFAKKGITFSVSSEKQDIFPAKIEMRTAFSMRLARVSLMTELFDALDNFRRESNLDWTAEIEGMLA